MKIKFATSNEGKLREFRSVLGDGVESIKIDLLEIQDENMESVAKHKAREAWEKLNEKVLIEDTSLLIESMNHMPGPFIKWFMKGLGNNGLILATDNVNRKAKAVTYIAMYDGHQYMLGVGEIKGHISTEVIGDKGFGWDSIFIPDGSHKTFGEMEIEKNKYSMRRMALEDLLRQL